jgi:AcrR family transcriptional regulator
VEEELGLRERKKRETRLRIADVAMGLFMQNGFDHVTVAEIAGAADVSVNTVFNYFKTKEELFFDRRRTAEEGLAKVVSERPPGESLVAAMRRDFLTAIETRDWRYGLVDGAARFARMAYESPTLMATLREMGEARREALAAVLADETDADPDDPTPRIVAAQVEALLTALSNVYVRRRMAGESANVILPSVREAAVKGFDLLESGIGDYPGPQPT